MAMMISTLTIEYQIEEKKFFINLMIESILTSIHDPNQTLQELLDLRYYEDELRKLEEGLKK